MVNGAFAFLDCLGWKGIWTRKELRANPDAEVDYVDNGIEAAKKCVAAEIIEKRARGRLGLAIAFVSDTVVISVHAKPGVTLNDYELGLAINLAGLAASQIATQLLFAPSPLLLRGVITCGQHAIRNNIFLGPAVDEAAELAGTPQGAFVWLTPNAERLYRQFTKTQREHDIAELATMTSEEKHTRVDGFMALFQMIGVDDAPRRFQEQWKSIPPHLKGGIVQIMLEAMVAIGGISLFLPDYEMPMRIGGPVRSTVLNPLAILSAMRVRDRIDAALSTFDSPKIDVLQKKQNTERFFADCLGHMAKTDIAFRPFHERVLAEMRRHSGENSAPGMSGPA